MAQSVVALGCPADKVHVHHLGVDVAGIPFQPLPWQPKQPLRVLIAAAFREKKGIPYALAALGRLKEKTDLQITIIGDASPTPDSQSEKQKILKQIDLCGLTNQVQLLGFQPYSVLAQELYRHHLFLSPSILAANGDSEGGAPVTLIEAAAAGLLVVSTTHCDIPEVVKHGKTGWLANERNVDELVHHIEWLLSNPDAWPAMQRAARNHIEQEFDANRQGERLARLYCESVLLA